MLDEGDSSHSGNADSRELAEISADNGKPKSVAEVRNDRCQAFKKQIAKTMPFNDQLDLRDVQCVAELADCIFKNMRQIEQ